MTCTVNHARLYACTPCPVCGLRDARRTAIVTPPGAPMDGATFRRLFPFAAVDALAPDAPEPCAACGSSAGDAPGEDGNPRCLNCGCY